MTPPRLIGCQTYTWQMLGTGWDQNLDTVLDAVSAAGFDGIEVTNRTIGSYRDNASALSTSLASRGLQLSAFACSQPSGWTDPTQWDDDLMALDGWLAMLRMFPTPTIAFGGASVYQEIHRGRGFQQACRFYNEAGRRAAAVGVTAVVHPSSHAGSILTTAGDYQRLLDALDPTVVNFGPDTGHMLRGGQNVVIQLRRWLPRIQQLHIKDVFAEGHWAPLGQGALPLRDVLDVLDDGGFAGWMTLEEESGEAAADPPRAVAAARRVLRAALDRR